VCNYKAISLSIGGGSNRLDNNNGSKHCADRTGIAETGLVGTYRVRPKGQVEVQIASHLILNRNISLIGKTAQLVKVRSTEIPNQRTLELLVSRFFWNVPKYLGITSCGWRQSLPVSKLRPLLVEISSHTVRHKTADHNVNFTKCRRNG
jgi:hypothetical protein